MTSVGFRFYSPPDQITQVDYNSVARHSWLLPSFRNTVQRTLGCSLTADLRFLTPKVYLDNLLVTGYHTVHT